VPGSSYRTWYQAAGRYVVSTGVTRIEVAYFSTSYPFTELVRNLNVPQKYYEYDGERDGLLLAATNQLGWPIW
jgi:hypothetical protein